MLTSSIEFHHGVPTLFVNGAPQPSIAYITYLHERGRFADFAQAGYRLYSFAAFFGTEGINVTSGISPFDRGMFDDPAHPDFSVFDERVQEILSACPEAQILPRVNVSLSRAWERAHPDECCDTGYADTEPRACFASPLWRETVADCLRALIDHIEASNYAAHIIGYQLAAGNTEEWIPFDLAGGVGKRSRERYLAAGGDLADQPAFRKFLAHLNAETILTLARAVKEHTGRRLIVGCFYGYTFEVSSWIFAHGALHELLDSPDIDFLCSPVSYAERLTPGGDRSYMLPMHSAMLHGKMVFAELDIRTHLTRDLAQCRENAVRPGTYTGGVWNGFAEPELTVGLLRACFARRLAFGYGSWWFDMWGGWYADPAMMAEMRDFAHLAERVLDWPDRSSLAETALFIDEAYFAYADDQNRAMSVNGPIRRDLARSGVLCDVYLASDYDRAMALGRYKAVILALPADTVRMEQLAARNPDALALRGESSPEELREFCRRRGVHIWCESGDVVYANRYFAALYASGAGEKRIALPDGRSIAFSCGAYECRYFSL